jgi:YD repeat-containing protein
VISTYDDGGNLQSTRDPLNGITSYAYDKAERRVRVQDKYVAPAQFEPV